ncbi:hypothetical protein A0H76_2613 [Hepatospora eriocheir]|uniref:Uncharacterized protein n=1 Tax=Hepatospora eriocheir TaxID=1081669 RepID=A0A1X0QF09_9MICR|nr:hypothetical protein A0H76_2613 [Hepatospora eriocheir]
MYKVFIAPHVSVVPNSDGLIKIEFNYECLSNFNLLGYVAVSKPSYRRCNDIRYMAAYKRYGEKFCAFTY